MEATNKPVQETAAPEKGKEKVELWKEIYEFSDVWRFYCCSDSCRGDRHLSGKAYEMTDSA